MAVSTLRLASITLFLIIFFNNSCVGLCSCSRQESEALLSLNFTFSGSYFGTPWTNKTDCCEWDGIMCDKNDTHVERIFNLGRSSGKKGVISDGLCKLPFLVEISIWNIGIGATVTLPSCLGDLQFLQYLVIGESGLSGVIPTSICMLKNLTYLSLKGNKLSGSLPFCLNNLSSLISLDLSHNRLSGPIPLTWGYQYLPLLAYLDVSFNQLSGTLPLSFARLASLRELYVNGNRFNDSTPSSALPSSIRTLHLSLSHELTISESFFHNLGNLQYLSLSNCTLNISTSWIPNFQLYSLELESCEMDGRIPPWISTQFKLTNLALANNGLAGEIPSWLWDVSSLYELNLSQNHLHGSIFPNGLTELWVFDVSSNVLSGYIPSIWPRSRIPPSPNGFLEQWPPLILMLNDNLFTGNIPPSLRNSATWVNLNLENNKLDGMIPWCLMEGGSKIQDLNVGGNNLQGRMPEGLTISSDIRYLVLRKNQLSGTFLPSFRNDTTLQVLDIGHNSFRGHLPRSIGNISSLQVLLMKDNQFSGNIPPEIGMLNHLQILDLSSNFLQGSIPHDIIFLRAMTVARDEGYVLQTGLVDSVEIMNSSLGGLNMTPKGTELSYPYILSTLTLIDISNNRLNGDIPLDFGKLKGLKFLNLSMNDLTGIIPPSLGDMDQLEALDFSSNNLSGNIPLELQSLSYLAYLDLSDNNLYGSIPQGGQMITFEYTSYSGNPNLNGCPLPKNCSWPKFAPPPPRVSDGEHKDEEESEQIPWYQIGVGWSYGAGFVIVAVLLLSVREKWRMKYFKVVDTILKPLFPFVRNRRL